MLTRSITEDLSAAFHLGHFVLSIALSHWQKIKSRVTLHQVCEFIREFPIYIFNDLYRYYLYHVSCCNIVSSKVDGDGCLQARLILELWKKFGLIYNRMKLTFVKMVRGECQNPLH